MSITASKFFSMDPRRLTADVEDRFFTDLKTANNTFKRTASERFADLDECCIRLFAKSGTQLEEVLDIGISSGATTLKLCDRLRTHGHRPNITGTDIALSAYLVPVRPGMRVLADENGHALQYEVLGRGIRAWTRRADYFTGMIAVHALLKAATHRKVRRMLDERDAGIRKIDLLSPRLRGQLTVRVERNDIMTPTPRFTRRFDFIRVANVLNKGYFDEATMGRGFSHILTYLRGPGSWLLVARTNDARNAATLFRMREDGSLAVIERWNGGSEVEKIALSVARSSERADA